MNYIIESNPNKIEINYDLISIIENKLEEFYLNSFTKNEDEISYDELKDSLKNFDLLNLD